MSRRERTYERVLLLVEDSLNGDDVGCIGRLRSDTGRDCDKHLIGYKQIIMG